VAAVVHRRRMIKRRSEVASRVVQGSGSYGQYPGRCAGKPARRERTQAGKAAMRAFHIRRQQRCAWRGEPELTPPDSRGGAAKAGAPRDAARAGARIAAHPPHGPAASPGPDRRTLSFGQPGSRVWRRTGPLLRRDRRRTQRPGCPGRNAEGPGEDVPPGMLRNDLPFSYSALLHAHQSVRSVGIKTADE
jgi:hypothetical protein